MVWCLLGLRFRLVCEAFYLKVIYRYHEPDVVKVTKEQQGLVIAFQKFIVSQGFLYTIVISFEISVGLALCWQDHIKLLLSLVLIFLVWQMTEEECFRKFLTMTNMVIILLGKGTLLLSPY